MQHLGSIDETGASAVEYGLLVSGVALMIVTIVTVLGFDVLDLFTSVCEGNDFC